MNDKNFQQQVNELAPYSQINKAFRHTYGSPAAAVLATLIYKYTYWEENNGLSSIKTKSGNTLHYFYISKLDISLDSGVSISSLEKDNKKNPLNILEDLQLIKKKGEDLTNKADRFVLFPNRIKRGINRVSKLFEEDMEMIKTLPRKFKRDFYRSLKGKRTRDEVYKKFSSEIEDNELDMDDLENFLENPASIEAGNSPIEGRTKNSTKNSTKNTNPSSSNRAMITEDELKTTTNELKAGINDYVIGDIDPQGIYNLLKNYIPDNKASKWSISKQDEKYIKQNLSGVTSEYMTATIDYININIERMINGDRKMRFGSMLAGIFEKVINAGIGVEPIKSKTDDNEHRRIINREPIEQDFDFEDVL